MILSLGAGILIGALDAFGMALSAKYTAKIKGRAVQAWTVFSSIFRLVLLGLIIIVVIKQHSLSPIWFIAGLLPVTLVKIIIAAGAMKKSWNTEQK